MQKYLLFIAVLLLFLACERKPYVEHKLEFEKTGESCGSRPASFRLNSNFGGERYEFKKCLPADFSKDQVVVAREGSKVLVNFPRPSGKTDALFNITLDIDSYPKYDSIVVDGEAYAIISSN